MFVFIFLNPFLIDYLFILVSYASSKLKETWKDLRVLHWRGYNTRALSFPIMYVGAKNSYLKGLKHNEQTIIFCFLCII